MQCKTKQNTERECAPRNPCELCKRETRIKERSDWTRSELKAKGKYKHIGTYYTCDHCKRNWIHLDEKTIEKWKKNTE